MSKTIHIQGTGNLREWPRVMLQPSTGHFWLVNHHTDLKKYPAYRIDQGDVVMRDEITDLIELPAGTSFTVTNS